MIWHEYTKEDLPQEGRHVVIMDKNHKCFGHHSDAHVIYRDGMFRTNLATHKPMGFDMDNIIRWGYSSDTYKYA